MERVLCGRCLLEFMEWRYSQSCWYFRPSFVNYCTSHLLSGSSPPPPHLCQSSVYATGRGSPPPFLYVSRRQVEII
jgi:hypothetical protein